MSRLLLLNLLDKDVDALTRVRELDPAPDIVVYHRDPDALVVRLARLARLPVATELPDPHPGDVVVCPENGGTVSAWRSLGARVLEPGELDPRSWERVLAPPAPPPPPVIEPLEDVATPEPETAAAEAPTAEPAPPRAAEPTVTAPEPAPAPEPPPAPKPSPAPEPVAVAEPPVPPPAPPSRPRPAPAPVREESLVPSAADVLATPEDSFRWLIATTLGARAEAVLWWDGSTGVWVPWVATGELPPAGGGQTPQGLAIQTEWGNFVLSGPGSDAAVPRDALIRVCEDLALRDLVRWERTLQNIPSPGHFDSAAAWFRAVSPFLAPEAALVWQSGQDAWALVAAEGAGIEFSGTVTLPGALLTATFESGPSWHQWEPRPGLRVYLRFREEDPRWPVRLRRLEQLGR